MRNDTLMPPPVNISQVLRSASVFDFKRHTSRQSFMDANNISQEAEELFDLLESRGVTYLLVGGLAMLTHVRGRNTDDVDLIISVPDQRHLEPEIVLVDPPEKGGFFALGGTSNCESIIWTPKSRFSGSCCKSIVSADNFSLKMGKAGNYPWQQRLD